MLPLIKLSILLCWPWKCKSISLIIFPYFIQCFSVEDIFMIVKLVCITFAASHRCTYAYTYTVHIYLIETSDRKVNSTQLLMCMCVLMQGDVLLYCGTLLVSKAMNIAQSGTSHPCFVSRFSFSEIFGKMSSYVVRKCQKLPIVEQELCFLPSYLISCCRKIYWKYRPAHGFIFIFQEDEQS